MGLFWIVPWQLFLHTFPSYVHSTYRPVNEYVYIYIAGEEMTFVVRVWDFRYGREGDAVGSTTITIEIERSGMTLCVDLVGKLRKDGYITDDDFHATVFFGDTPLVGFDAMQPLSYFGIGRGSVLDIKLYSNEIEEDFVSGDEVDITDYIPIDQVILG